MNPNSPNYKILKPIADALHLDGLNQSDREAVVAMAMSFTVQKQEHLLERLNGQGIFATDETLQIFFEENFISYLGGFLESFQINLDSKSIRKNIPHE